MKDKDLKIGGGGHLQYYDLENGQYCDEDYSKLNDNDLKSITLNLYYDLKQYNIFHFPTKPIHGNDYADIFIQFVRINKLYESSYIDDNKIQNYLFEKNEKNDKSKIIIEILGYPNNAYGWRKFRDDILKGTDFSKMKFDPDFEIVVKIITITKIKNYIGNNISFYTIWELTPELNLRFITLIPRRIKNA